LRILPGDRTRSRLCGLKVAHVLANAICLYLLALQHKLLSFHVVELKEKVHLIADGTTEVVLSRRLLGVQVA